MIPLQEKVDRDSDSGKSWMLDRPSYSTYSQKTYLATRSSSDPLKIPVLLSFPTQAMSRPVEVRCRNDPCRLGDRFEAHPPPQYVLLLPVGTRTDNPV